MKKSSIIINFINIALLISIVFYNIFLNGLSFRFDYILITLFIVLNIKHTFLWIKNHNIVFIIILFLYGIYLLIQCISINGFSITNIYNYRYIVLDTIYPILLFMTIINTKVSDKTKKYLYWIVIALCTICVLYGIINFIFDFNLFKVNSSVLNKINGRVQSFYTNPNAYKTPSPWSYAPEVLLSDSTTQN